LRDEWCTGLGNCGLFGGNVGETGTQELLVVEREVRNCGDKRPLDHVRRVEPAAEAYFEDAGVGGSPRKCEDRDGCRDLEKARFDPVSRIEDFGEELRERLVIDEPTSDTNTLVEANEVRACKGMDAVAACFEGGTQERDGRSFSVRAGDVKDRRKPILRSPQAIEHRRDPFEAEAITGWRELREAVELRLDARMRRAREVGHQAAFFASGAR
jgi:hypothetical protein